jgi:beta-glucosidase
MSDWAATHGVWPDRGLDQDMPGSLVDDNDKDYYNAGNLASVPINTINTMVYRILLQMITVGAFDNPVCAIPGGCNNYLYSVVATNPAHVALARTIASNSAQLLSNDKTLPLDKLPSGSTIAVIGSACDSDYNLNALTNTWNLGNYYVLGGSGRVINPNTDHIVTGISNRAKTFGYKVVSDKSNNVQTSLNLWKSATVAIVCGGTTATEGNDRANLVVDQDNFINQLLSNNNGNLPPIVVLLSTPGPVLTNWRAKANAVVNMFLAGEQTANAWADVLFGTVNPSGRLPMTFPLSEADTIMPCSGNDCPYREGLFVGYRGLINKQVAFPFGHGLSYTTFDYTWVQQPSKSGCQNGDMICMQVKISNNGTRDGSEVPQLYMDYPSSAGEPMHQLRSFTKVPLKMGESATVYFGLNQRHLSIYQGGWNVVRGQFSAHVGASSRDTRLTASFTN